MIWLVALALPVAALFVMGLVIRHRPD